MSEPSGSPLRHREFALYLAAQVCESFALSMATVAIGWQVYDVRENPLDLALIGLAEFLPLPLLAAVDTDAPDLEQRAIVNPRPIPSARTPTSVST